jgi:hypothetical protein
MNTPTTATAALATVEQFMQDNDIQFSRSASDDDFSHLAATGPALYATIDGGNADLTVAADTETDTLVFAFTDNLSPNVPTEYRVAPCNVLTRMQGMSDRGLLDAA